MDAKISKRVGWRIYKKSKIMILDNIQDGDILFKNTEMSDKKKKFLMRVANWVTSKIQGIDDKDHVEVFHWTYNVLSVSSSVFGGGVRTQTFENWRINEGSPKIEILRAPKPMNNKSRFALSRSIAQDRGLPYGLIKAIKARLVSDDEKRFSKDLREDGVFCSEIVSKWVNNDDYLGDWPDDLYKKQIDKGYTVLYKGESKEIH